MSVKKTFMTAAVMALSVVSAVEAQERRTGQTRATTIDFSALDRNADGLLTPDDMVAFQIRRFAAADTDGDGKLSEVEVRAQMKASSASQVSERATRLIARADTNKDGFLQSDEMNSATSGRVMERLMSRLDTNRDGAISKLEFEVGQAKLAARTARNERSRRENDEADLLGTGNTD